MSCETCNAATELTHQEGGTESGKFKEEYTCVNGHKGMIRGEASDPANEWRKTGAVFNEMVQL